MADEKEIGKLSVSVALDGTGFQQGVSNINKQLAVVQSEFKAAAAQIGDFGDKTDGLKLKADSLNQQIDLQKQKISVLADAFNKSADSKGADARATQDLQIKLNKAKEALANMENDLKKTNLDLEKQSTDWKELGEAASTSSEKAKTSISGLGQIIKSSLLFGAVYEGLQKVKDGFEAVVGGGIKFDSTMQQNQIAFTTMLGSAEKAKDLMSQITNMASTTPFETADLTKASKELLSFGVSADQIMPTMKMLGDVSQGDKSRFDSLTLAFAQIQSAGKMQGGDLLQLVNAGFNPLQVISQKTGKSMAELRDEMAKGAISADMVTQAFKDATSQGGMFYNAMQNQSTTFEGLTSTLKDNLDTTFGTVMKPVFEWLTNTALPKAIDLTTKFSDALKSGGLADAFKTIISPQVVDTLTSVFGFIKDNFAEIGKEILVIGSAVGAFKGLSVAVEIFTAIKTALKETTIAQLALNAVAEINPYVAIGTAVVAAAVLIYTHWDQVKSFLQQTWDVIKSTAETVWNGILDFFKQWGPWMLAALGGPIGILAKLVHDHWDQIKTFTSNLWNQIVRGIQNTWNTFTNWISGAAKKALQWVVDAFEWMYNHNYYFKDLVDFIKKKWQDISNDVATWWNDIRNDVSKWFNNIVTDATDIFEKVRQKLVDAWSKVRTNVATWWGDIKADISKWFSNIVSDVDTVLGPIFDKIGAIWTNVKKSVSGWVGDVRTEISKEWDKIVSEAEHWGENLIHMIAKGISNTLSEVASAAKKVASTIAGYVGFHSPTEEGPASDSDMWAPNFVRMFAGGISAGSSRIADAAKAMVSPLSLVNPLSFNSLTGSIQNRTASMMASGGSGAGMVQVLVSGNHITGEADENRLADKISQKLAGQFGLRVGGQF